MIITWPTAFETQVVDEIRGAIGRDVTFVVISDSEICPVCGFDPISESALDPFCTTCSGLGYLYTYSGVVISGHVTWNSADLLNWQTGGKLFDGDVRVQIKYTQANLDAVDNMKWAIVDGKEMFFKKKTLRGVQSLNRILIDMIERNKEV